MNAEPMLPDHTTVALLEDQRVLRDTVAELLEHSGFQVIASASGPDELMQSIRSHPPALLVVDLRLSFEDDTKTGWQTVTFVRKWMPSVKVVVLSGSRDSADIERARALGAAGFLNKDALGGRELVEALRRIAAGERVFPVTFDLFRPSSHAPAPSRPSALDGLTTREVEVLRYIGAGFDNLKIAACLDISERTVRAHVSNLYRKLGPENRAQLALLARELGLRPPEK